jgi:DNA-binding response OmpR family regulator
MQGARILLLDDDRETRWALATVLRREGAQVTEAVNGEEGLRLLARGSYDLCISDVCMPSLGGFGVFAALRFGQTPELETSCETPIFLLSGRVSGRELAQALDAGVEEFLEKPPDPEEFKARVRAILRRQRQFGAPRGRTCGEVSDLGMAGLVQALHCAARSARLEIQSGRVTAILDFQRGELANARFEDPVSEVTGEEAAVRALGIEEGRFEVLPVPETTPRTVFEPTDALLLRAATRVDESVVADAPRAEA